MNNAPHRPTADAQPDETRAHRPGAAAGDTSEPNGPTMVSGAAAGASRAAAEPGRLGDYRVVRKIGTGGMGAVYLAEDVRLGRYAAVKVMRPDLAADPESRSRFEREARAAAAVEHDNLVPIWCIGEGADGTPYIAMPFLQGEMLDDRLKREPVSPLWLLVEVGRDAADGLAAAHARGLVHRDIKPANIWLEGDPQSPDPLKRVRRAKVLDFGLARSVVTDETQLTASGVVLGTPAYMSPEQARGAALDARADLWSLGATLYRMATGRQPFQGATTMAVLVALIADTPPPVRSLNPAVPPALAELIDQLLQKDPAARPVSAEAVAARLRKITEGIDLVAAKLAPLAAAPPTNTGAWAGAGAGETEADEAGLGFAEPLVEEAGREPPEPTRGLPVAPAVPPPPARVAVAPPAPARRPAVPPPATFDDPPFRPRPRTVPLPLALMVLLLLAAAGLYVVYPDAFARLKWPAPAQKVDETPPKITFQKPGTP